MLFAYDTELAVVAAAALVNTAGTDGDALTDLGDLDRFLEEHDFSDSRTHDGR